MITPYNAVITTPEFDSPSQLQSQIHLASVEKHNTRYARHEETKDVTSMKVPSKAPVHTVAKPAKRLAPSMGSTAKAPIAPPASAYNRRSSRGTSRESIAPAIKQKDTKPVKSELKHFPRHEGETDDRKSKTSTETTIDEPNDENLNPQIHESVTPGQGRRRSFKKLAPQPDDGPPSLINTGVHKSPAVMPRGQTVGRGRMGSEGKAKMRGASSASTPGASKVIGKGPKIEEANEGEETRTRDVEKRQPSPGCPVLARVRIQDTLDEDMANYEGDNIDDYDYPIACDRNALRAGTVHPADDHETETETITARCPPMDVDPKPTNYGLTEPAATSHVPAAPNDGRGWRRSRDPVGAREVAGKVGSSPTMPLVFTGALAGSNESQDKMLTLQHAAGPTASTTRATGDHAGSSSIKDKSSSLLLPSAVGLGTRIDIDRQSLSRLPLSQSSRSHFTESDSDSEPLLGPSRKRKSDSPSDSSLGASDGDGHSGDEDGVIALYVAIFITPFN
jgi:hypothetical protein